MASNILHYFHHILMSISILLILTTSSFVISLSHAQFHKATLSNVNLETNSKIPAIFVFGDSTVDPGNNNYIVTAFKGNFAPYGRDFVGGKATGRFTNGRLVTDFISSYAGVKEYIPPYLDSTLTINELKTGVSFASAGTGLDPLTAKLSNVISISKQMEYFREYRSKMEGALGNTEMNRIIEHSIFVISAGTNDFGINYFLLPIRQSTYNVTSYQSFLLTQLKQLIQDLRMEGGKKIGVVGLPPVGCLPVLITLFSKAGRSCVESFSSIARDYNQMVKNELSSKTYQSQGLTIAYADAYAPLDLMFKNPEKFGFEEVSRGCCGTGAVEASYLCNPASPVCTDVSKYAFFDSIHPTEKAYRILYESFKPLIDFFIKQG